MDKTLGTIFMVSRNSVKPSINNSAWNIFQFARRNNVLDWLCIDPLVIPQGSTRGIRASCPSLCTDEWKRALCVSIIIHLSSPFPLFKVTARTELCELCVLQLTISPPSLFIVRKEVNCGQFLLRSFSWTPLLKLAFTGVPPYWMTVFLPLSVFKLTTERHIQRIKYYFITVESQRMCQLTYVS